MRQFKTRKLQNLGHLIRHNTSQPQLIEGQIEYIKSRGRQKTTSILAAVVKSHVRYPVGPVDTDDLAKVAAVVFVVSTIKKRIT